MDYIDVLGNSLRLLRQRPKVFFPRILTTLLYTALLLAMTKVSVDSVSQMMSDPSMARQTYIEMASYFLKVFVLATVVYGIDIITYAMYPRIVRDYKRGADIDLGAALADALTQWKTLLVFAALIIGVVLGVSLLAAFLHVVAVLLGSLILDAIVVVMVILSVLFFSVLFFFVVPISVIEKKGVVDSFRKGMRLSRAHKGPVTRINVVFMIITLATMFVAVMTEFEGAIAYTAILLFVAGRLIQASVATYISVVNPYFYISISKR